MFQVFYNYLKSFLQSITEHNK